ncbi:MAG: gamma-glutamylcyclotransferase family protein [Gammaproteobacteria bacterium]
MSNHLLYFAYGSNMHPRRMKKRAPHSQFVCTATLHRYKLYFHKKGKDESGKCNAYFTDNPFHRVFGVVYRISASDKLALDKVEGLGSGYDAAKIDVFANNHYSHVFAYLANPDYIDDQLIPFSWYKQLVIQGAGIHGFPASYVKRIQNITAIADTDAIRARNHLNHL